MRPSLARMVSWSAVAGAGAMVLGAAFLLFSNWWIHRSGQDWKKYDALDDVPAREIVIVPGVGDRDGEIRDRLRSRLLAALTLYRAHKAETILVSGVGQRPGGGDEVSSSRAWLLDHGVDPAHIIIDRYGMRTLDTVQRAAKTYGVTGAIVCSQAQHLDRTLFLARAAGIDAVGFIAAQHDTLSNYEVRLETLKSTLAFVDTYVLHTGPSSVGVGSVVASSP